LIQQIRAITGEFEQLGIGNGRDATFQPFSAKEQFDV